MSRNIAFQDMFTPLKASVSSGPAAGGHQAKNLIGKQEPLRGFPLRSLPAGEQEQNSAAIRRAHPCARPFGQLRCVKSLPQWVKLQWPQPIKTKHIEIITSEGYPLQNYQLQYRDGSAWRTLQTVSGNQKLRIAHQFVDEIETTPIRLLGLLGPNNQPAHVRVNEILVNGSWVNPPNKPPVAKCSATPNSGTGVVYSDINGSSSYDTDGSIRSYHWRFSAGGSATGKVVHHSFVGRDPSITEVQRATLTVTDNEGAKGSATCTVTILCSAGAGPAPKKAGEPVDMARVCAIR